MKLQFDANQQYQLDAVSAVTDLFDGQPQGAPEYSVIQVGDWGGLFAGQARTELGVGNHLLLAPDKLLGNTRTVQARNDIEITDPASPLEVWELFDTAANAARDCPHFSVEMETGPARPMSICGPYSSCPAATVFPVLWLACSRSVEDRPASAP